MTATDYLILIQSANLATILTDPIGPSPYSLALKDPQDPGSELAVSYLPASNVASWRQIDLKPRGNTVGVGEFTANATPDLLTAVFTPEARIAVLREPEGDASYVEMAGPIEHVTYHQEAGRDGTDRLGEVTVQFADDLASLATRLVYPNPAQAATAQTVTKYTISAVNAEDAARALVNLNAGPGALVARRFPELVLGVDHGVGTAISTSFVRSVVLTDALREVLRLGGNLGMRAYQDGAQVKFEVYAPQNLTATVWFSRGLGNVKELTFEYAAPTATVALAGDATAGVARVVRERVNTVATAAGWRRKEAWVDARSAANAAEVDQAGDEALKEAQPTAKVSVVAIETEQQKYREHFNLLDLVSVEVFDGMVVQAAVTGVDITVTPERGEVVVPLIGSQTDAELDVETAELRKAVRRIAQIEGSL